MYDLTAAHKTYPFNTIVRVTNLSNGKSVKIRVNDRMPDYNPRIIDLSYGAAIKLDMLTSGIAEVKLEVLKWGEIAKRGYYIIYFALEASLVTESHQSFLIMLYFIFCLASSRDSILESVAFRFSSEGLLK